MMPKAPSICFEVETREGIQTVIIQAKQDLPTALAYTVE
jgi:hypothetical protein